MFLIKRFSSSYQRILTITNTRKQGDSLGVKGWIKSVRRLKNVLFFDICDGSTNKQFQLVVPRNEQTKNITTGTNIYANGCIQIAPNGSYELHANDVKVIADGHITSGYPFTPKQKHAPEYVRQHLHLRTRVDHIAAVIRLRHHAQKAIHDVMYKEGFVHINTPILTKNDCEGAGEVFIAQPDSGALLKDMSRPNIPLEESYFDGKVYLTVSGQLHLEAMTYGLGNTYTIAPAFRAENCKSPLHLAEFYMFEAELAFVDDLSCLIQFLEQMLKKITLKIMDTSVENLQHCQKNAKGEPFKLNWLEKEWTTLTYDEALNIIYNNKHKFGTQLKGEDEGFSKEQELFLVEHCGGPVFVIDWPAEHKPFYMKTLRSNPKRVHAVDLLMPFVGELCGGSLRESDMDRLSQHPHLPNGLEWYLDLRKFGGIPTGGFGMGFERYLQLLTGVKNIRDVIPFPRYPHNCNM